MTPHEALTNLRAAIRAGRHRSASELLARLDRQTADLPAFQIEALFLGLLEFRDPGEMSDGLRMLAPIEPTQTDLLARRMLLEATLANRILDPLTALSQLQATLDVAGSIDDVSFRLDTLIEMARVYTWLGNYQKAMDAIAEVLARTAGNDLYRFLALYRAAFLYAELERWEFARRYAYLAMEQSGEAQHGIYWFQLIDCAARIELGLNNPVKTLELLDGLSRHDHDLPSYLQFRWRYLQAEAHLGREDIESAALLADELLTQTTSLGASSFEAVMARYLAARLDIKRDNLAQATSRLASCYKWFEAQDLAVPLTDAKILIATCFASSGDAGQAAKELDGARLYCESRGLPIQTEKIAKALTELNLNFEPAQEANRIIGEKRWRARQAYVLLDKLGSGAQGTVYRAHDNQRDMTVALKRIAIENNSNAQQAFEALSREVQAVGRLPISGIARIIACGKEDPLKPDCYIVQEYVPGSTLRSAIPELAMRDRVEVLSRIATTIASMHRHNVVHADIKPENIILSPGLKPVLVDFGVSGLLGKSARAPSGTTLRYSPPARALRLRDRRYRDLYAFGIVIQETLGIAVEQASQSSLLDMVRLEPRLRRALATLKSMPSISHDAAARIVTQLVLPVSCRSVNLDDELPKSILTIAK